ncbi:MAG TPA: ABC transporter ATP-binding protein [Thermodesulfobacteriota bacterium]|nr:ABC transporter ATP-binding protein [Thermodesulfobacteriota bacterium]
MMLAVRELHVHYGSIRALKGVSLEVREGEVVALIGANGAGKTTLLNAVSGFLRPTRGAVSFRGEEIQGFPPSAIVPRGIVQVPEGRSILTRMTVLENLEMGAYLRGNAAEVRRDLGEILARFPRLMERKSQLGGTLSGGEQQMLAIGRALMARPRILLLDEPSMGLSPIMVKEVFRIVHDIKTAGTTLLLVEQNARMALRAANRGYVLENGSVVLHDSAENLLNNPQVREAYLGA